jgi:precorrin-6A/cobalt-precorrin-6A reductase
MSKALLILGGTGEAASLARRLAEQGGQWDTVTSLAGRLPGMPDLPGRLRVGGFGGTDGLRAYLEAESIAAVIDATHPFAAEISAHARAACDFAGVPRLQLWRPEWVRRDGDNWIEVDSVAAAAKRLPGIGERAFLTVGANEIAPFAACRGVWFLVRLIKAPAAIPLAAYALITARGPYPVEGERELLATHAIDVVVSKASGGAATEAKITAAREAGVPVLMVRRPPPEPGPQAGDVEGVLAWLESLA